MSLGKNAKLVTWDKKIWYFQIYDADSSLGLNNSGSLVFDIDIEMSDENVFNTTGSKLWTRVQLLFKNELEQQYAIMRQKQFTVDNMMKYIVDEQISQIPSKYYNIDMQSKYLNYGSSYLYALHGSGYHHIRKWLRERLVYCDTLFGYNVSTSDYITLRANKLGEVYLDIQTYIPMYVRIKFRDEANSSGTQVKRVGRGETVRFSYNLPTATDQEIIVYAGHYLKSLGDVSNLQPSTMLIANADRLTEITCHSPNLINTDLSECTLLQRIDLSDSTVLGTGIGAQPILNIQNCKYLRYCNCMNTQLTAIYTMQQGGNLEELYFPETTQVIQVTNQTYLHTIGIPYPRDGSDNYCKNLATVQITNCNAIKYIQYPYVENEGLKFESLKYVQNLSITNSMPILTSMSFRGFNKLKNITLSNLPNLATLGFDNMLNASDISTFKTMTLSNMPKVTKLTFNVDSANYKIAFAGAGKIDMGGLQSALTIESNYSIKGLDTIILPNSIKELRFSTTYGDGINEIKNLWSATSNHASDGFMGIDFQDMTISYIDMLGLSQVSNAINFNIAPVTQPPNMNTNRDGTATKPYFKPTGTINLNNYTGSMVNMLKGVDLSRLTVILDNEKSQTDLTSLFQGATIVEADKTKINNILAKFPYSTIWDYMFAYSTITSLEGINIGTGKLSLKGWAKGSNVTKDIAIAGNITGIEEMFMNCVNLTHVTSNWKNTYLYTSVFSNCYKGCSGITHIDNIQLDITEYNLGVDEIPTAWGGFGFTRATTGIYVVEIPSDNYSLLIVNDYHWIMQESGSPNNNTTVGNVNWGDGTTGILSDSVAARTHTYAKAGTYTIKAQCILGGNYISTGSDLYPTDTVKATLVEVKQVPLLSNLKLADCTKLRKVTAVSLTPTSCDNMFSNCTSLSSIVGIETWDFSNCTTLTSAFRNCSLLTDCTMILGRKDLGKITSINSIFNNCTGVISDIDLSNLPRTQAIDVGGAFFKCGSTKIEGANGLKIKGNAVGFAQSMPNVTYIDLSEIDTSQADCIATHWEALVYDNPHLTTLNLSNAKLTPSDKNLMYFGMECPKLTNLIMENMDIKGVTSLYRLFEPNNLATYLDVSTVDVSSVGDMTSWNKPFNNWSKLVDYYPFKNIKSNYEVSSDVLSVDSLVRIMNNLVNVGESRKLIIGVANLEKLTAEQKAIATNKGWTLS